MSARPTDPLLLAGRVLTIIMQAILAIGAVILAILIPIIIFARDHISAEIIEEFGSNVDAFPLVSMVVLFALAIGVLLLAFGFFGKLRQIIGTVELGDPFVPENADRLTSMAWLLTAMYGLIAATAAVGISIKSWVESLGETFEGEVAFSFDLSAILTIVVLFILARVFRKGTEMRDDLEGTV